jgi:hypothetical protein
MHVSLPGTVLAVGLLVTLVSSAAVGQDDAPPAISQRQYTGGSIKVSVTGSLTLDEEIPINAKASFSGDGSTWLQFGVSGAAEPNVLITYGETGETGITVGRGKLIATGGMMPGEQSDCSGKVTVEATLVTGAYTCKGITTYEPGKGMGKIDMKVAFTAKS